ncbi:MAG: hypothetical protein CMN77_01890 [Spirochaetaceae bacterium]|nr:hypothetical protein [Spirochaetaceae bacterium]|tara:strand:+ start:18261 stop:18893 length:633 start_codon:yes stop_codon:yes gene_type:complete
MQVNNMIEFYFRFAILGLLLAALLPAAAEEASGNKEVTSLEFSVRTESSDRFTDEMMNFAKKSGGYLVTMRSGYLELRLPASLGREGVESRISAVPGTNVYRASRATEDVSGDLVDLRARLKVAESNLGKLRALSREAGMDDLLDLERALNRSLEEVEELKGEIRYLEESATLFSVKIQINSTRGTSDPETVRIPWVRGLTLNQVLGGLE